MDGIVFAQSGSSWLVGSGLAACGLLLAVWRACRGGQRNAFGAPAAGAADPGATSACRTSVARAGAFASAPAPVAPRDAERAIPPSGASPPARPPEALLAEDNDVNALILTRQLERLGFRVTRVATGADAVATAAQRPFEVVLLDWRMPEMDGLQAIRLLRRLPGHATTPIVVVTANALDGDRETCLDAGADAYLPKPVEIDRLRGVLGGLSLLDVSLRPAPAEA
ncbi:MAG: response regulator [Myxococcota bacterium]